MSEGALSTMREKDDWSYVLITGDAVVAGAVPAVFALLARHGLEPVVGQVMTYGADSMDRLYGGGSSGFFIQNPGGHDVTFSLEMHDELYGLVPACLVLVSRCEGGASSAVLDAKGRTLPEDAKEGTIRSLGENVIFNLVHCPDDAASAQQELIAVVGAATAERLVACVRENDPQLGVLVGPDAMLAALPRLAGPEASSFTFVANRLRLRAVQHLAILAGSAERDELVRAHQRLGRERTLLAGLTRSGDRLKVAQARSVATHALISPIAEGLGQYALAEALGALAEHLRLYGEREPERIFTLADAGVYLGPLERIIVQSHSYAFRPNDTLSANYA